MTWVAVWILFVITCSAVTYLTVIWVSEQIFKEETLVEQFLYRYHPEWQNRGYSPTTVPAALALHIWDRTHTTEMGGIK